MSRPMADRVRPENLNDVVGQEHILGNGKVLSKIITSGMIPNMIFFGPPGTGKTTVANIAAKTSKKTFYKLNATNASISDIKEIIKDIDTLMAYNGILLYLDEIQNFNKKQQQSLLEFIENGKITLIASTTENPYFYIYNAILSRCNIFEFKALTEKDIILALERSIELSRKDLKNIKISYDLDALKYIANISSGDLRKSLNTLELIIYFISQGESKIHINIEILKENTGIKGFNFDRDGDSHYDILSAFQKSIRGSDANAAMHYLARLIKGGDLISICRRLMVIASEDIGLAYPTAISVVKSCVDAATMVGFPEARIILAQATLVLATSPKSNSVIVAIDKALDDIEKKSLGDIPPYLKDAHYEGANALGRGKTYKYPHIYKNNYVNQQYLPDNIKDEIYYTPGNNKMENTIKMYFESVKND